MAGDRFRLVEAALEPCEIIRLGMFVRGKGRFRCGVVAGFNEEKQLVEVHEVDTAGLTVLIHMLFLADVTQCLLTDIPAPRRPAISLAHALGYR